VPDDRGAFASDLAAVKVRIAGFGGQGVVMAGYTLGRAAIFDGLNALQTQSYGSESRGGAAKSDVILSPGEILDLAPSELDVLICMSQPALDTHLRHLKPGGLVIYDSGLVKLPAPRERALGIPATTTAVEKFGRDVVANAIFLGALAGSTRAVSAESLSKAISESVPPKTVALNLSAFQAGRAMGTQGRSAEGT
jgi:2-oxoglutarate ferredoxin oxidoreductase subunit gamma